MIGFCVGFMRKIRKSSRDLIRSQNQVAVVGDGRERVEEANNKQQHHQASASYDLPVGVDLLILR